MERDRKRALEKTNPNPTERTEKRGKIRLDAYFRKPIRDSTSLTSVHTYVKDAVFHLLRKLCPGEVFLFETKQCQISFGLKENKGQREQAYLNRLQRIRGVTSLSTSMRVPKKLSMRLQTTMLLVMVVPPNILHPKLMPTARVPKANTLDHSYLLLLHRTLLFTALSWTLQGTLQCVP